jgi:hypothetical protein
MSYPAKLHLIQKIRENRVNVTSALDLRKTYATKEKAVPKTTKVASSSLKKLNLAQVKELLAFAAELPNDES